MASSRRAPSLGGARSAPARPPRQPALVSPSADGLLRIGQVAASHGLQGALRVRTDDPASTTLTALKRLFVETAEGRREFQVRSAAPLGPGTLRVMLDGIEDADAAQALKGCAVMVAAADLPPLGEGEFYYFQLAGAEVMLTDGRRLGAIAEIFSTGAHDVWVVRDGAREVLVPVIADVVKAMDLGARRVTIEPIPGLLD